MKLEITSKESALNSMRVYAAALAELGRASTRLGTARKFARKAEDAVAVAENAVRNAEEKMRELAADYR